MADLTTEEIAGIRAIAEEAGPLEAVCAVFGDRKRLFALLDMAERCAKAEAKAAAYDKLCESQREQWSSITRDIVRGQNKQEEA